MKITDVFELYVLCTRFLLLNAI